MGIAYMLSATRGVIEQTVKWADQRKAFGKRLIDQPVVRSKLAHSIAELESVHNWYENVTYQMTKLPYEAQSMKLGGAVRTSTTKLVYTGDITTSNALLQSCS